MIESFKKKSHVEARSAVTLKGLMKQYQFRVFRSDALKKIDLKTKPLLLPMFPWQHGGLGGDEEKVIDRLLDVLYEVCLRYHYRPLHEQETEGWK